MYNFKYAPVSPSSASDENELADWSEIQQYQRCIPQLPKEGRISDTWSLRFKNNLDRAQQIQEQQLSPNLISRIYNH